MSSLTFRDLITSKSIEMKQKVVQTSRNTIYGLHAHILLQYKFDELDLYRCVKHLIRLEKKTEKTTTISTIFYDYIKCIPSSWLIKSALSDPIERHAIAIGMKFCDFNIIRMNSFARWHKTVTITKQIFFLLLHCYFNTTHYSTHWRNQLNAKKNTTNRTS